MMKKLLIFAIVLLFTVPCFGQWAQKEWYGSAGISLVGEEDESPIGMYVGIGSQEFKDADMRWGFVFRVNDRLSLSAQTDFLYDNSEKDGEIDAGLGVFYFIGRESKLYFRGNWIPHYEDGEKPDFEQSKGGMGYMARDGIVPFINLDLGTPFILDFGRTSSGAWEYHALVYFEF